MNKYFSLLVGLGCCAFLASCGKEAHPTMQDKPLIAQLGPAKHFDIPVPLSFTLCHKSNNRKDTAYSDFMRYAGSQNVGKVVTFYKREMERAGWEISDLSSDHEGFLYCTKPTKLCGIEIRSSGNPDNNQATTLCLFITQKT